MCTGVQATEREVVGLTVKTVEGGRVTEGRDCTTAAMLTNLYEQSSPNLTAWGSAVARRS